MHIGQAEEEKAIKKTKLLIVLFCYLFEDYPTFY